MNGKAIELSRVETVDVRTDDRLEHIHITRPLSVPCIFDFTSFMA